MSEYDNLMPSSCSLGSVNGGVVRFCATVCKERLFEVAGSDLVKLLCQIRLRLVGVKSASVRYLLQLINDCLIDPGGGMTYAYCKHTPKAIQAFIVLIIPDVKPS